MAVVVHFRNGTNQKLAQAKDAAWVGNSATQRSRGASPRWLVCRNERGDILGTFEEADITGFQVEPKRRTLRFRMPRLTRQSRS